MHVHMKYRLTRWTKIVAVGKSKLTKALHRGKTCEQAKGGVYAKEKETKKNRQVIKQRR